VGTLFFRFDPLAVEIARKLDSMTCPTEHLYAAMMDKLKCEGLDNRSASRVDSLFAILAEKNLKKYEELPLNHPIRVAALWWDISQRKEYETVALGLCHNLHEAGDNSLIEVEQEFLSLISRSAIAAQSIDRSKERDPAYLGRFYDNLNANADSLILKGCDKLDNFLSYGLYDLDPYYFMVLDEFVSPRLNQRHPKLAAYLQMVADHVRTDEAKTWARRRKSR